MQTKNIISFLNELQQHNNRDWLKQNDSQYKNALSDFAVLVNELIARIASFDESIGSPDARDCIFRIHRDVRFSANKDPYKTHFGAYIARGGRKSIYAGYYLHFQPASSFAGGGIYMPEPHILKAIRTEIYNNAEAFKAIIDSSQFKKFFNGIYGQRLKTCPKGFDKDFRDVALLSYKDYAVVCQLSDREVLSDDIINRITQIYKAQHSFNAYLNAAISNA